MNLHIGKAYNESSWNCAHVVHDYYYQLTGVGLIKHSGFEWDANFLKWMRLFFEPISTPEVGCLVVCRPIKTKGALHVGVVIEPNFIYHATNMGNNGYGQTMITEQIVFETFFSDLRYYKWKL